MSLALPPAGTPLATHEGRPVAYTTLGATFHLEPLDRGDETALEEVNALILDWFGPALKWTASRALPTVDPFQPDDLDMIALHTRELGNPLAGKSPPPFVAMLAAAGANAFYVAANGAEQATHASPYAYRFHSVILEPGNAPTFETASCLAFTVPSAWPLDDFYRRVCTIAQKLRIRWGAAGFMYGVWEFGPNNPMREAVYAHARRYVGYDVSIELPLLEPFHDRIRTVNWLTFVGRALADRLAEQGHELAETPLVRVSKVDDLTLIAAGDRPQAGDVNRRNFPRAYAVADAMVRPVRASGGIHFRYPWTEDTTERWLRRFELKAD